MTRAFKCLRIALIAAGNATATGCWLFSGGAVSYGGGNRSVNVTWTDDSGGVVEVTWDHNNHKCVANQQLGCAFSTGATTGGYALTVVLRPGFYLSKWDGAASSCTPGRLSCALMLAADNTTQNVSFIVERPFVLAPPPNQTAAEGSPISMFTSAQRAPGYTGPIALTASSSAQTTVAAATQVSGSNSDRWTVTLDSLRSALSPLSLTLTADGGGYIATTTVTIAILPGPGFNLSVAPNEVIVTRGETGAATLSVTRTSAQVGSVRLLPRNFTVRGIEHVQVGFAVGSDMSASSPLSIHVPTTDPNGAYTVAGTYAFDIEGAWQGITKTTTVTLKVLEPDYKLTATPNTLTIPRGGARTFAVNVNRISPVIQDVDLSKQNEPPGIVAMFPNSSTSYTEAGNSTNVDVSVASNVPTRTYKFQIQGSALGVIRSADVTVIVIDPPITTTLAPAALIVPAGTAGQTLLAIGGLGYMQGGVTVRVPGPLPAGVTVTISPLPTSFSNFVVDVTAAAGTKAGAYQIPIQVIHLGVTYTVTLSLTIT